MEIIVDRRKEIFPCWNRNHEESDPDSLTRVFICRNICECIKAAKNVVAICTFLLSNEDVVKAIEDAVQRGVRVYMLLASENSLEKNFECEDDFSQMCVKEHADTLKRLQHIVSIRSNPSAHAKFVISDWYTSEARGVISTGNFTKEGIGSIKENGRNEEFAVEIDSSKVNVLANIFKEAFWNQALHEMVNGDFKIAKKLNIPVEFESKLGKSICTSLNRSSSLHDSCMDLVKRAKKSLYIAAFGFEKDNDLVQEIAKRAKEGLKVTILARIRPKNTDALKMLEEAGCIVYGFRWLHAKLIVADEQNMLMMTGNFENLSFQQSFEVGAVDSKTSVCDLLESWIETSGWRLIINKNLENISGIARHFIGKDNDVWTIRDQEILNIGGFILPSLHLDPQRYSSKELKLKKDEGKARINSERIIPKVLKISWNVVSPRLKDGSIEIYKNAAELKSKKNTEAVLPESFNPKVYKEPDGKKVVAIKCRAELDAAKKILKQQHCEAIVYA